MQDSHCLFCKQPIAHYHHHYPQHRNGSDTLGNMVGLCEKHHTLVHNDQEWADKLDTKHTKLNKKYGAVSVLNQAIPFILVGYVALLGADHVYVTDGYTTHHMREAMALEKKHDQDAYVIACSILNTENDVFTIDAFESMDIRQFRRHDRSIIKSQNERTYKLDEIVVAKNRKKRMDQKDDSLADWYLKTMRQFGRKKANALRSQLTVEKSRRRYNNPDRVMPGTVFLYEGKRHVLKGQMNRGNYYLAFGRENKNIPARDCVIVAHNAGLVAI